MGVLLDAGEIFQNHGLARTLRKIVEGGKAAFYQGEIAEAIARWSSKAGGCLTVDDLAAHTSTWDQPISTTYRNVRVWECPPNGQGLAALLALNLLEGFDIASLPPLSTQRLHLMIEAMRLAFADTRWYVADPAFNPAPLEWLLSKDYAARAAQADPSATMPPSTSNVEPPPHPPIRSTSAWWMQRAMRVLSSIVIIWALAQVLSHRAGVSPYRIVAWVSPWIHPTPMLLQPGKRPYHTIIPG